MRIGRHPHWTDFLRRLLAASCAALIFTLGLFAASPTLHEQLHHNDNAPLAPEDDACAIVLFADGVSVPVALHAPPPPALDWVAQPYFSSPEIFLDSPRYLLRPERGPPVA